MTGCSGKASSRAVGMEFERQAAAYLEQRGYQILQHNYRCRMGEIDLVAREGQYLCFIEVKYRKTEGFQSAFGAVNAGKQHRISQTALCYLMEHGYAQDVPCRFDVVGITPQGVELLKNAFPFRG